MKFQHAHLTDDEPPRNGNGFGLPALVRAVGVVGVPALIAFYLLGMIPYVPSPFREITASVNAVASTLTKHEMTTAESIRVSRLICRGMWKGNPEMQEQCGPR